MYKNIVCHPEAGLLESLASRISVELTVEGSRFPRLLCSVRESKQGRGGLRPPPPQQTAGAAYVLPRGGPTDN